VTLITVNTWLNTDAAECRAIGDIGNKDSGREGLKRVVMYSYT